MMKKKRKLTNLGVCKDCKYYKPKWCNKNEVSAGPQDFCMAWTKKEVLQCNVTMLNPQTSRP